MISKLYPWHEPFAFISGPRHSTMLPFLYSAQCPPQVLTINSWFIFLPQPWASPSPQFPFIADNTALNNLPTKEWGWGGDYFLLWTLPSPPHAAPWLDGWQSPTHTSFPISAMAWFPFPVFFFSFLPLSFLGFGLLNVRKGLDLLSTNYMQDAIHKSWIGYPRLSLSNINKCDLIWALVESRKEHTRKTNFRFLSCLTKHYSTQFRWTFGRGCSSDWFLQPAESLDRGPFALCLADKQAPWWHLSPRSLDTHGRVWSKLSGSTRYVKLRTCIFQA